ncbi:MAG: hypothetical protein J6A62_07520 [Oscillospiraceae bacterium]|nr:hypothetical protein [Oscillospiraceae bacterium]
MKTDETRGIVLDQKAFDERMEDWLRRQAAGSQEANRALEWASKAGIADGTAPGAFMTREETADMIRRALTYFFERIVQILEEN